MQNIYVWIPHDGLGRLLFYNSLSYYPYVVTFNLNKDFLYNGIINSTVVVNCMVYTKHEIKFLHKKPLRHFIEKR